jgi:hypothetical protein
MPAIHSIDPTFALFRRQDAADFEESGIMHHTPLSDVQADGAAAAVEAGMLEGTTIKLLFSMPGMSLTHVWFKSGFPLPRHSHDTDCLYYITAGSLKIGTENLGKGDGFFVGASVPYTYTPGPEGVEVLEFRGSSAFDIKVLANSPAFWAKALQTAQDKKDAWATEAAPSDT